MEEVYQRELKWVGLIGMENRKVDTPEFREETINNLQPSKRYKRWFWICKTAFCNTFFKE